MSKWRPISTAPINETILVQHIDDLFPVPAYQLEPHIWLGETEGPEDAFYGRGRHEALYREPTHWQPLPDPPDGR